MMPYTSRCNTIVSRGDGGAATTDFIFQVGYNGATCGAEMRVSFFGSQAWHVSSNTIPLNTWTHVAVTYDGAEVKFYINGNLDRIMSRNGSLLQGVDQVFYIGRQGAQCACNFFDGQIDDLRIWNVVRSAAQIRDNYLRPLAGNESGLTAYWKFDEAINTLPPLDATGHGFNGSLINGARYVSSDAPMAVHAEVATLAPTQLTAGGATLSASVNPSGWQTTAYFEYGPTTNYGFRTAGTNMGAGITVLTLSQPVSGLLPSGTYHYRVMAENMAGQSLGNDTNFTLPGLLPTAVTETASGITGDAATLNGTINPRGTPAIAYFEYGRTPGYGSRTASTNIGGGNSPVQVTELVSGLELGFTYHFRVLASNSFGVIEGDDLTFNLSAAGPTVLTLPAENIGATRATLRALVSPNGAPTQVRFDYGPTPSYGASVIAANNLQGASGITVTQTVTGLPSLSQIYWRAAVSNPSGSGAAAGVTFRTLSAVTNVPFPTNNTFKIPVSTVRPARARGGVNNGQLSFLIDDGGAGYTSSPPVTLVVPDGAGSGGEVNAVVDNGAVSQLTVVNHGNYTVNGLITVNIAPPPNPIEMVLTNSANDHFKTLLLPAGRFEMTTVISRDVEIQGQGPGLTILSGGRRGTVLRVQPGVTVTFRDLSITQGEAASGGGIYNDAGHVSVYSCDISDNRATGQQAEGGGIYNRGDATMVLENCSVRNNFSARTGGGISSSGINTQLPGVPDPRGILDRFVNRLDDAAAFGVQMISDYKGTRPTITSIAGAMEKAVKGIASYIRPDSDLDPGVLVQKALGQNANGGNTILGNTANEVQTNHVTDAITSMPNPYDPGIPLPVRPGGVRAVANGGWAGLGAPILVLNRCSVSGNRVAPRTSGLGGGIHSDLGLVLINDSVISGNSVDSTVASFGGGVSTIFGAVSIVNSRIEANEVKSTTVLASGAGIDSISSVLNVQNCSVIANASRALFLSSGGGINNTFLGTAIVNNSVLTRNFSGGGGAVANLFGASLSMDSCTISSNSVGGIIGAFGGGILNDKGGSAEIANSLIYANSAEGRARGGGVYNHAETVMEFLEQGLFDSSDVKLVNCTISSNRVVGTDLMVPHPMLLAGCYLMTFFGGVECDYDTVQKFRLPLEARGGGVYNGGQKQGAAMTELRNCTIVGNAAYGTLSSAGGIRNTHIASYAMTDVEEFGSDTGIFLSNTILAYNTPGGNCADEDEPFGFLSLLVSRGFNLDTDGTLASEVSLGGGIITDPNAGVGPLANNGGPTLTHGLLAGSPALNAGNPDPYDVNDDRCPSTDQRGVARDARCDIGAFESVPPVAVADTYEMVVGTPLVVDAAHGLLSNDFAAGGSAQLETGGAGAFRLNADGSFVYENNAPGTYVFLYVALDALNQTSAPVTVTITVRPMMKIVSISPQTNRVDAPRNGAVTITFDTTLAPETVPSGLLLHGAQSARSSFGFDVQDKTLTVVPSADWHGSEQLTLEILQTLRGTNGASLPRPVTAQFLAGTTSSEGTFRRGQELGDTAGRDIALGDLDGDGDLDMYIARRGGDQVWRNLGDGTFALVQTLEEHTSGVALADLDGDGDLDAFVTKNEADRFPNPSELNLRGEDGYTLFTKVYAEFNRVLFNDGNGHFSDSGQRMSTGEPFGDERTDYSTDGGVIVPGPGQPYLLDLSSRSFSYGKIYFPASEGVALADLDGDGDIDAFVINGATRTTAQSWRTPGNTVWLNNGRGFFTRTEQVLGEDPSEAVALGDLDGDGDIDAFVANRSYKFNAANRIWLNDGHGRFTAGQEIGNANFLGVALGDVDNDGDLDAVTPGFQREFDEPWQFGSAVWLNDGTGHFLTGQHLGNAADTKVSLVDFNGDGRLDACLAGSSSATIWINSGNGQFAPRGPRLGQRFAIAVATGDLDNDGDADVVMANDSPFANYYSDEHSAEVWLYRRNPVARPDSYGVLEDGQLVVSPAAGLLNNDSTPQGTPLAVQTTTVVKHRGTLGQLLVRFGSQNFGYEGGLYVYNQVVPMFAPNGSLNLNADGSFTYTPNKNFFGTDSFQYVISDGVLTATSIVTIVVSPVNDAPLTTNDFYALANPLIVNAANGVLANDRDPEGNLMVASLAQPPAHGTLNLNTDGSFTYTPNPGYTGTDAFTYQASDGQTQTVARVKLGNTPPVAVNDAYLNYTPGTTLSVPIGVGVLSNDNDPDGDTGLLATLRLPPTQGNVQLGTDGSFTYTPNPGYSGADFFTYEVSDGMAKSAPARVKIGNAQPLALPDSYSVVAGFSISGNVLANDTDADGEMLTAQLVTSPASGQLTLNPNGAFTYSANSNFAGNVTFSYRASDGFTSSVPATATIAVNAPLTIVNVSPPHLATDLPTNAPVTITFSGPVQLASLADRITVDGSRSYPWNASAGGNTVTLSFARPFLPGETIRVSVKPGIRGTQMELANGFTWQFQVEAARGSATFVEIPVPTIYGTNAFVALGDLDGDGDLDAFVISGDLTGVTLMFNDGAGGFTAQPAGDIRLRRRVVLGDLDRDGDTDALTSGGSTVELWRNNGTGTFTITTFAAPVFTDFIELGDLDADGDLDVFAVGSDVNEERSFVWTWFNDGQANFTVSEPRSTAWTGVDGALGDLNGDGALDAYLVGLRGDQAWFNDGAGHFSAGTQVLERAFNAAVRLGDLDGDGDMDAFVFPGEANRGPRVLLNDGTGRFALPRVQSPPMLTWGIALGDVDGDGDLDAIEAVVASMSGRDGTNAVWLNNGTGSFTRQTYGFPAGDSQAVALGDLDGDGDVDAFFANGRVYGETNKIWMNRSAPVAHDDFYAPNGSSSITVSAATGVLSNDATGDGGAMSALLQSNPARGSVALNADGSFTYTPGGSFTGTDVFTYSAVDNFSTSVVARVKIGNTRPNAANDSYIAVQEVTLNIPATGVLATDTDADGDSLKAVLVAGPTHGTLQLKSSGAFTYASSAGYVGADTFTYYATDGLTDSASVTVTIDVRAPLALVQTTPRFNENRASASSDIVLRFNRPINAATVSGNVAVHGSARGQAPITTSAAGDTVTLNPVTDFRAGEKVIVTIASGLEGAGGQRLLRPIVFQFTVAAPVGSGSFGAGTPISVASSNANTVDVALGDLDRDGDFDALLAQNALFSFNPLGPIPGSGAEIVWRNNGAAAFTAGPPFGGSRSRAVALADLDGDGDLDAVVGNQGPPIAPVGDTDYTEIWFNNGSGAFSLGAQSPGLPGDAQTVRVGDLDGDRDQDLFILQSQTITVWLNNGSGQFTGSGQTMTLDTPYEWVELGDLDNDGDVDAFVIPSFSGPYRVFLNDGSGRFTDSGQPFNGPNLARRLALGDLDGDGDLDAYIARSGSDEVWINDGTGAFTHTGQSLPSAQSQDVNLADIDGDGDLDAIVLQITGNPPVNASKIWFNNGAGIFHEEGAAIGDASFAGSGLDIADLDGDGDLDVFLAGLALPRPEGTLVWPPQVWLNRAGLSAPTGTSKFVTDDKSPVAPFAPVVLRAPAAATISLRVLIDNTAKGTFSAASLATSGFTSVSSNAYALSGRSVTQAQDALRQLVFVPTQNRQPVGFSEATIFTLEASDGTVTHRDDQTTVRVVSANDPPTAVADEFVTTERAAFVTANVFVNDADPDPSEAPRVVAMDLFGTVGTVVNRGDGTFNYDPDGKFASLPLGATASDSFGYTVDDGHGATASARVTIVITGENSAPVARDDAIMVYEYEGSVLLTPRMLANDSDIDVGDIAGVTVSRASSPARLLPGNVVSYTPDFPNLALGSSTNDSFTYTIADAHGATADATVFITVRGWNDAPLAQNDVVTIAEDAALTNVTTLLLTNDTDADPGETATLAITGVDAQSTKGLVTLTNGFVTYSPNRAFNELPAGATAVDTFDYVIADIHGASSRATMILTIEGRNNAPIAVADAIQVSDGAPATDITAILLANDIDLDTNAAGSLVVTGITGAATNGVAAFDGTRVTYVPKSNLQLALGQFVTDAFTYTIRDAQGATASATATIFILGEDDPPVAHTDVFVVDKDAQATNITALLLANDTDPNGGTLVFSSVFTNGMKGLLTLSNGIVTYDPNGQFAYLNDGESFSDRFVYTVRDESGAESSTGAMAIVAAGNFPPLITPVPDQTVDEETALTFVIKASDADPAGLRFSLGPNAPEGASIDPITGEFSWTPTEAQGPGTNEIIVRVEDSGTPKRSALTSFFVRVNEVNRPPGLTTISDASALVGRILRITNVVTDPDLPVNKFTFALAPGAPATARILKNGLVVWKPGKTDARTTNQFTVTVTDNGVPPLSVSTIFRVGVSEFLQLSIGSAALPAGQTGSVTIDIESIVDVTNVQFALSTALDRLTNFALKDFAAGVQGSLIQQSDRLLINFALDGTFARTGTLARLQFDTAANQTSAFVPLKVLDLTVRFPSGTSLDGTLSADGRVAIVAGGGPLLEALISANGQRSIALYGRPGDAYRLQSSDTLAGPWATESEGTLIDLRHVFDQPSTNRTIFYRAVKP